LPTFFIVTAQARIYYPAMPARALSTATISFGLVSIPVKLYSAAESKAALAFNQIHKKDGSRVKQQLISSRTGEVVPREEIVKGYEFAKDQYVLFEAEELKALEAAATHTIDITEFLKAEQVERRYLDKVYYLGTDKGGARAYKLLAQVLVDTGRIAIGKYAARGKQYLVMVRPMENGLVMEQLHYPDELRAFSEVPIEDATLKPAELKLATQLVEQAASDEFKPETYKDEVRERMLALIQRKVEGEDITLAPMHEPEHKIIDIMEALKASLAAGKKPAQAADDAGRDAGENKAASKPKVAAKKRAAK
jgi:DNA end-binding protein Ku